MSAIDADKPADAIVSDIKAHVDKFRQLTAEETQHFFSSLDGQGRQLLVQLLAERAGGRQMQLRRMKSFSARRRHPLPMLATLKVKNPKASN